MEKIHQLEQMKESLMCCVQPQIMGHLDQVDAKELGEAIDMIKDLSEAIYYCTITEAMKGDEKEKKHKEDEMHSYRSSMPYPPTYQRMYPVYYEDPRMYYDGNRGGNRGGRGSDTSNGNTGNEGRDGNSNTQGGNRGYTEYYHDPEHMMQDPAMMRDHREGRSGMRRKSYMEGKQMHREKTKQIQELDAYMQELTTDLVEMIQDASPEEKLMLQQKISTLATKIK